MPAQNEGTEMPIMAAVLSTRSSSEPWRSALSMPVGMPINSAQKVAPRNSSSVTGRRCMNMLSTGWPLPIESPQSPRTKWLSHCQNCVMTGPSIR